ncbi:GHKL domain-containing protein [Chryseobacterium shandongense]|uniref:histidine kinase n=1 Tax=Chryseobacterium shandongense TaxID=1493872 RepID=A0AAD0YAX9_9FLAO|nr:ATP-binding protein [Chryseobacterium shandongense]AZA85499.1 GHKL domain-containing protein [Chryseobacterium shandongense]AZA97671.1 GHKL domain-containing protein [Chryseobacterium shandongense]
MDNLTVERLRVIENLKEVPDEELQWLIDHGTIIKLPAGKYIFKPGDILPGPFIILFGKVRLCLPIGHERQEVGTYEENAIGGNLPFSRAKIANLFTEVVEELTYLQFPLELLEQMTQTKFYLTQALVHVMANRIKDYTAFEQQTEKMMALGKLSAGLAHELNNPAAAVVRGAAALAENLKKAPNLFSQVISFNIPSEDIAYVCSKITAVSQTQKPVMTMMERSSLEDDLFDWLEREGVADTSETAEILTDFGFGTNDLAALLSHIPEGGVNAIFAWINSNLVTEKIVNDIKDASARISNLVGAVKNFTHMDQGHGKKKADIHIGIRNTLIMLEHKIRNGNVNVIEKYDTELPPVSAMIGELNQVWTNLLDNALDAMEPNGSGQLTISTHRAGDCVHVTISDNGTGIPESIKGNIFNPFFTTKPIGKGTGLGLDVVMRIVKQHKGVVKVSSNPGKTDMIVEFPIEG